MHRLTTLLCNKIISFYKTCQIIKWKIFIWNANEKIQLVFIVMLEAN